MAKTRAKSEGGAWETVKTVFWALMIALVIRSFLYQPFSIPSGSMKPTLLIGDYLFVSKFSYGYSNYSLPFAPGLVSGRVWSEMPERGDVIVFKHPKNDACSENPVSWLINLGSAIMGNPGASPNDCTDYVKRLVGLPGDEVQVKGGILYINGERLPTRQVDDFVETYSRRGSPPSLPRCVNSPSQIDAPCVKEHFRETLPGGREHSVLNFRGEVGAEGGRHPDDTPLLTVPEGHFFFMGDNRDNSVDSRFVGQVGMVPFENLIGRAEVIAFSSDGSLLEFWNWRFDRFFKSIE